MNAVNDVVFLVLFWLIEFKYDLFAIVDIGREGPVIMRLGQNLLYVNQYLIWYPPLFAPGALDPLLSPRANADATYISVSSRPNLW